jgi:carbon-monoxide dehydrogenase medium subunit
VKAAAFDYSAPATTEAAVATVALSSDGKFLAGGQSLGPMMQLRLATPTSLVDLTRLAQLQGVTDRGQSYAIGAAVTHAAIEDGLHPVADGGMLAAVARNIAYRAVRNRGTIGGSLAHADPAADWLTTLTALGAELTLVSPTGRRTVPMHGFILGAFTTALEPGELIEAVLVPKLSPGAAWGYQKICKKTGEFADAIGAVVLDPDRGFARIVAGAMSGAPVLLPGLAAHVAQDGLAAVTPDTIGQALAEAAPDLDRVAMRLHSVAIKRALLQALTP